MKKHKIYKYFCLLLIIFLSAIGCVKTRIPWPEIHLATNWHQEFQKIEIEHFVFYASEEKEVDIESQERFYKYVAKLFEIEPEEKITYIKCKNSEHIQKIMGKEIKGIDGYSGGYKDKNKNYVPLILSTKEWENHELIHTFQHLISETTSFFCEGLATAYEIDISKTGHPSPPYVRWFPGKLSLNWYLQNLIIKREQQYIDITEILTSEDFEIDGHRIIKIWLDDLYRLNIVYIEAGSFVRYLLDSYGLKTFFRFLKISDPSDSKLEIEKKFLKIYGISIREIEKQWLNFLRENY